MKKRWQLLFSIITVLITINGAQSRSTESRRLPRKFLITKMSDIKDRTMDINYVHQVSLSNVTEWSLDHNEFENYTRLHTLIIADQSFDRQWYANNLFICSKLSRLELTDSQLKTLSAGSFTYTPNLTTLNLAGNHLEYIERGALKPLTKLKVLDLSRNSINSEKLERLDLLMLPNLTTLILTDNNVDSLFFVRSGSLKSLDISKNMITQIVQADLMYLPHLDELVIRGNRLKEIDAMAFSLSKTLRHVDLSENGELTSLPNFQHLPVTQEIEHFSCVKCNLLVVRAGIFWNLYTIKTMDLSYNHLERFPKKIFEVLQVLNTLKLAYNKISHIPDDMFEFATALTDLSLTGNPLKSISVTPFLGLPLLRTLYVDNCGLEHIWDQTSGVLDTLKYLNARENQIQAVSYEEMMVMENLTALALFGNPLRCGDDFMNLIHWMEWQNIFPMEMNAFQQSVFPICHGEENSVVGYLQNQSFDQSENSQCPPQTSELMVALHTIIAILEIATTLYIIWSCGKNQIRAVIAYFRALWPEAQSDMKTTDNYKPVVAEEASVKVVSTLPLCTAL